MTRTVYVVYLIKSSSSMGEFHSVQVYLRRDEAEKFLQDEAIEEGDRGRIEDVTITIDAI